MDRKHSGPRGADTSGLGPGEDRPAGGPFGIPSAGSHPPEPMRSRRGGSDDATPIDPELESDLGAEFPLRGDVIEGELENARREAAAHLDTARRLQADFDNYRKRLLREQEETSRAGARRIVSDLLPVVDNLERALAHAAADDPLNEGVAMVLQQMLDVFAKEGVERIDALGEPFDPNEHQAVGSAERADVAEDTCVAVYHAGYRMQGRVLRPASVVVSCKGPARQE